MEQAFLATLSQAAAPAQSGRRHSVVTISKAPKSTVLFGRNRRESFAAFSSAGVSLGKLQRRDSSSSVARSPSISGSTYNLQLDIMDDIAEIKAARKVKLKVWQAEGQEMCEVQEGCSTSMYHQKDRRFSDITGMSQPGPSTSGAQPRRRASEAPPSPKSASPPLRKKDGIVCSNTDLIDIVSSLTSSAQEIGAKTGEKPAEPEKAKPSALDNKRDRLKGSRSNSLDIALLPDGKPLDSKTNSNWFARRHVPMASKKGVPGDSEAAAQEEPLMKSPLLVTLTDEKPTLKVLSDPKEPVTKPGTKPTVLWDKPTGSVVDPQLIGSAIEVFLTQRGEGSGQPTEPTKAASSKTWFGAKPNPSDEEVSCDNSICSTIKDLFVK